MFSGIKQAKLFVLDLLFPKFCVSCGKEGYFLCPLCAEKLTPLAPACFVCGARNLSGLVCRPCRRKTPLRKFFAPFSYKDETVRKILYLYKYGRAKELAPFFGDALARMLVRYEFEPEAGMVFVPIPLHKHRRRERGFNQSELIAEFLADKFNIPLSADSLIRVKRTRPQIELEDDKARQKNLAGAFTVKNLGNIEKKTVLLVDDVTTSGATLNEAAKILKESGARAVWALTVARR